MKIQKSMRTLGQITLYVGSLNKNSFFLIKIFKYAKLKFCKKKIANAKANYKNFIRLLCISMSRFHNRWASLLCIKPPKRYYHLPFFNWPGLQKPGRNHFSKNSCWVIKDIGILVSQNNLWTKSLIRVQGDSLVCAVAGEVGQHMTPESFSWRRNMDTRACKVAYIRLKIKY